MKMDDLGGFPLFLETPIYFLCKSLSLSIYIYISGQIVATSHDLGPQKVAFWKENPCNFQGNPCW